MAAHARKKNYHLLTKAPGGSAKLEGGEEPLCSSNCASHLVHIQNFITLGFMYHIIIKYLLFTNQCVSLHENYNQNMGLRNFSPREQKQDVGSIPSYLQKFLIHLYRQDVYWLETTLHPQRRWVFTYSFFWQNRIPLLNQVPWSHVMHWYTDTTYKNTGTECTSLHTVRTTTWGDEATSHECY